MSRKRKKYSADFKSKVVLEVLESGKTVIERDWAVKKLKSLDLSSKRNIL